MKTLALAPVVETNASTLIRLGALYARLTALSEQADTPDRKAAVARLGVKLYELVSAARATVLPRRDAVMLPELAGWLQSQIAELEAQNRRARKRFQLIVSIDESRAVA
jgi:hypothetical protein